MSDDTVQDVSNVRVAGAFLLDFFTAFFLSAYAVASLNNTGGALDYSGKTALIAVAVTILYFVIGKYVGGTLWQRVIRIK